MKKLLMINYWCLSFAWGMVLSSKTMIGIVVGIAMTMVLSAFGKKINVWRVLANTLLSYLVMFYFYSFSNISMFYPDLYTFLIVISINSALANELLCKYKSQYMIPFLGVIALGLAILSFMIILVPNDLYSLFSKTSLFLMAGFIFLPFLIEPTLMIAIRHLKKAQNEKIYIPHHKNIFVK